MRLSRLLSNTLINSLPAGIFLSTFLLFAAPLHAQVIWLVPENPPVDVPVTLYFNADQGNKNLAGYTGDVYLHTGVITSKSLDGHDWKYVVGNWGTADSRVLMKREGPNLYSFTFGIKSFYSLRDEDVARQLAFVFRNAEGTLVGKTAENEDITVNVNGYKPPSAATTARTFGTRKLMGISKSDEGWNALTDKGIVNITPYAAGTVGITFFPSEKYTADSSHAVILHPGQVEGQLAKTGDGYLIKLEGMDVYIAEAPFRLSFLAGGDTLLQEEAGFFAEEGNSGIRFRLDDHEKVFGTGERALPMDRRGYRLALYNRPFYGYEMGASMLNYSLPLTFSSKKYALLFDNPQKGYVDIGKTEKEVMEWGTMGGTLRYFVISGKSWKEITERYTYLTGRQPLPPRWAFGNLQSRMAYRNQQEADSIVSLMQQKDFPIDALILDFYWFGDSIQGHLGKLDWFRPAWPDPEGMIEKFRKKGVKTILITEPYIIDTVANYKDADAHGIFVTDSLGRTYVDKQFYFGPGSLIDIFKPSAREWFWNKYDAQIRKGIAGWWGDLGEPESHPSDIRHVNGKADEVHNIYGHYWDRMLFDKYSINYPDVRLFHLQRSGFAGTQRFAAFPWTGDVSRSWGGYQAQLPLLLTMSMSGLGYIHSDAGGFAQGVKDDELYTRWLQFAVFTPILRPHGSNHPSEPVFWSEKTQQIVRNYMNLRYNMLPYNYTLAWKNTTEGSPLMRPMFYEFPDDTILYSVHDQYMWGESFLVAPVIEKGQKSRKIYLPEGYWFDLSRDLKYKGNQWLDYPLTLDHIPVFIRAGSFIPFTDTIRTTDDYDPTAYTVWYFPFKQSSFTQYEDDGKDHSALKTGHYELIRYFGERTSLQTSITVSRENGWKGMPKQKIITFRIPYLLSPDQVYINGKKAYTGKSSGLKNYAWFWDGHWLSIKVPVKKAPVVIDIIDSKAIH